MRVIDLQTLGYRAAWERQEGEHLAVVEGGEERVLLLEHVPVITYGRRPEGAGHIVAAAEGLAAMGVEVVQSDRGGDVTFHGPGQLVGYPMVRLADHRLSVGGYVHKLEDAVIAALGAIGVEGVKDPAAPGVWVDDGGRELAKVCALGVRIRRGVSMHGVALNVTTDLRWFDLIVPCGLNGRRVTSLERLMGGKCPSMAEMKTRLVEGLRGVFDVV